MRGKGLQRQLVQADKQIIRTLPSDERMMAKIQHSILVYQLLYRAGAYQSLEFIDGFLLAGWRAARTVYSRESSLPFPPFPPLQPFQPLLPLLRLLPLLPR